MPIPATGPLSPATRTAAPQHTDRVGNLGGEPVRQVHGEPIALLERGGAHVDNAPLRQVQEQLSSLPLRQVDAGGKPAITHAEGTPAMQAARKDAGPEILLNLANKHGNDKLVVIALLNNKNTPAAALAKLMVANKDPEVRQAISRHVDQSIVRVERKITEASAILNQASVIQASVAELGLDESPDASLPLGEALPSLQAERDALVQIKDALAKDPSVTQGARAHESSPSGPRSLDPKGSLELPQGVKPLVVANPGTRARIAKDCTLKNAEGKDVTFKKGDPCIVLEKDGQKYLQQFENKGNWRKANYIFTTEQVKLDDVQQITGPSAFEGIRWRDQSFKKTAVDLPLFSGSVSPQDIKQGAIGDCYVIASLATIAAKNPEAIHQMIKDNGDGTVTVRLFDKPDPPKYQMTGPAFELLKSRQKELGLSDAQMDNLKSLTSGNIDEILEEMVPGLQDCRTNFIQCDKKLRNLEVDSKSAEAQYQSMKGQDRKEIYDQKQQIAKAQAATKFEFQKLEEAKRPLEARLADLAKAVKGATNQMDAKYISFEKSTLSTSMMMGEHTSGALWGQMLEKAYAIRLGSYQQMGGGGFMNDVFEAFMGKASEVIMFDASEGKSDKLFGSVKQALQRGQLVGAGTKQDIGVTQGSGLSAGEVKVDGLAGQHAYGVLDTVEMDGRKFVKVANPWGTGLGRDLARDYEVKKDEQGKEITDKDGKFELVAKKFKQADYDSAKKAGAGIGKNESWVEWTDFCETFDNLYISS